MSSVVIGLNYGIRILVVIVGLLVVTQVVSSDRFEPHIQQTFGAMMIAFGAYRTVVYHVRRTQEEIP